LVARLSLIMGNVERMNKGTDRRLTKNAGK